MSVLLVNGATDKKITTYEVSVNLWISACFSIHVRKQLAMHKKIEKITILGNIGNSGHLWISQAVHHMNMNMSAIY